MPGSRRKSVPRKSKHDITGNTANKPPEEIYRGPPEEEMEGGWPQGWLQVTVQRRVGRKIKDRYYFSPSCKKFRSLKETKDFLALAEKAGGDEEEAWKLFRSSYSGK